MRFYFIQKLKIKKRQFLN